MIKRDIKFKGQKNTLVGRPPQIDNKAPLFKAVTGDLKEVSLSDFKNKIKVITSFLSLDTEVCEMQLKEFNRRAADLSKEIIVLAISKDLPFAQKRFCASQGIGSVIVLSDYKYSSFGINYGILIKEMNLLSRAAFIIDQSDIIRYAQLVDEVTQQPNYDDVFNNLKTVLKTPVKRNGHILASPEGKTKEPLNLDQLNFLIRNLSGWELLDEKKLSKNLEFSDFKEAAYFVDLLAVLIEDQKDYPEILLDSNYVKINIWTKQFNALTENDFILARSIDELSSASLPD